MILFFFFFSVRPPKKSWKKIYNLSGGEKTLSSLALVFALHHFKPTPLYFMDEIDAALDFKNVSIVACYIYVSFQSSYHFEALLSPDQLQYPKTFHIKHFSWTG